MKILFVIASLTSGGAERVLSTLANYFVKKEYEVTIVTLSDLEIFYAIDDDINILSYSKINVGKLKHLSGQLFHIRDSIKKNNPDIIISFMDSTNVFTLISSVGMKIPVLISERNYYNKLKKRFWRVLRRVTYPLSSGLVVLSQYDYDKYDFVKSKKIIFNPLNIEKILDVKIEKKEKLLISVGSLTKQKGFDMLIKALSTVKLNDWKFLIIGEGPERKYLTSLLQKYNLEENVYLIGRKKNIFDYYKKASIFVLSSYYEGFPNVLAEAMAHGCACVAFDCLTGPSEIIEHNVNGYLVEANNIDILSQQIAKLIINSEVRNIFFNESLKIKEKLELSTVASVWEEYILTTIKQNKKVR